MIYFVITIYLVFYKLKTSKTAVFIYKSLYFITTDTLFQREFHKQYILRFFLLFFYYTVLEIFIKRTKTHLLKFQH